jgi:hypothetical protein
MGCEVCLHTTSPHAMMMVLLLVSSLDAYHVDDVDDDSFTGLGQPEHNALGSSGDHLASHSKEGASATWAG